MTATDELRRLFDERGVEYRIECKQTRATFEPFNRFIVLNERGGLRGTIDVYLDGACNCTWQFDGLTPEQAIAATLGRRTCRLEETEWVSMNCPMYQCSECDGMFENGRGDYRYCPYCGAKVVDE